MSQGSDARGPRTRLPVVGGIETGGTETFCVVATGPDDVRARTCFPTRAAATTIGEALVFFEAQARHSRLEAIGIAAFGPLDLDPASSTFGFVTTTPKPGWAHTDLAGPFGRALGIPITLDTDVNAAALGEHCWGAGRGVDPLVYLTVGTGIGGGALVEGRLLHGLVHPEMGHVPVPHDASDPYAGACPYHGDCLEGLASGPAMRERWHQPPETLPPSHPAWALEADYLALGLVSIIGILSPRRIVIGGGVMRQPALLPLVRTRVVERLARYLSAPPLDNIESYLVPPALGDHAGVLGAVALAQGVVSGHQP